jgi:DNA-binding NtrC family response regulator
MIPCLLVTAEKQARDVIKVGLDQAGAFEVDVAEDSWALEMVRAKPYQVVIADGSLGDGADGLEFLTRVREILPHAEVLLISRSKGQAKYAGRDRQKLGVYAYVQFPLEPLDFFKTLGRLVDRMADAQPAAAT